jgi:aldose 1-epimerase
MAAEPFGAMPDGRPVTRHTLERDGLRLRVITLGATVQSLEGGGANVALGFADLAAYLGSGRPGPYFGATIGRYANRIAGARFVLDGREHRLTPSDGPHALHGGADGFDRRVWTVAEEGEDAVTLRLESPDGDQGFPGALTVEATYALAPGGVVALGYRATTDAPTVVALTNHTSFNLAGEGTGDVLGHELELAAGRYLPVGPDLVPADGPAPVAGTPFDFTTPAPIGARIRTPGDAQLVRARGYDHAFVLDRAGAADGELALAARLRDPASDRSLAVWTTEPGVQLYAGGFLDGTLVGTSGRPYRQGDGVALETEALPDTPNRPAFGSVVLRPGETSASRTEWRFA